MRSPPPEWLQRPRQAPGILSVASKDLGLAAALLSGRIAKLRYRLSGRSGDGVSTQGAAILGVDPRAIAKLARGRRTVLISGTNGKSTTAYLAAAAMDWAVALNFTGANTASGVATALSEDTSGTAVLELDELYLPRMLKSLAPKVIALLNLSRDQLDRMHEVRMVTDAWRAAMAGTDATLVANCADPNLVHAVGDARCVWFDPGTRWPNDASACPNCAGLIQWTEVAWACSCGLAMPRAHATLHGQTLLMPDGGPFELKLRLPGAANRANAVAAVLLARELGVEPRVALDRMAALETVWGRYGRYRVGDRCATLILVKNPAGMASALEMLPPQAAVIVGINAGALDGRDTSWLYDAAFDALAGRAIGVTGERRHDIALRLHLAGTDPIVDSDVHRLAGRLPVGPLVLLANYTVFLEWRKGLPCVK